MLNGSTWFCTIDLRAGFWQVAQDPADANKTTFITRKGRVMDLVLAGLTWETCLVYIDDVIIFARSTEAMLERLEHVFQRLQDNNLKVKPSKLCLFQQELSFLGYRISGKGIGADAEKTSTVLQMAGP